MQLRPAGDRTLDLLIASTTPYHCATMPPGTGGFCWCKVLYCPHALADGNQRIRIREKMLEFSTAFYIVSLPYLSAYKMDRYIDEMCCMFPASLESSDKDLLEVGTSTKLISNFKLQCCVM